MPWVKEPMKQRMFYHINDNYLGEIVWFSDRPNTYYPSTISERFGPHQSITEAKFKIELMAFVKPNTEYRKH